MCRDRDWYKWRLGVAIDYISSIHVEGLLAWCANALPETFDKLTIEIPQRINAAWGCDQIAFGNACFEITSTYRFAADLARFCWPEGIPATYKEGIDATA